MKPDAPFTRTELAQELDRNKIGNRMLFGGNLFRQPAFVQLRKVRPESMRLARDLTDSDKIMNNTLFLGTYPGLTAQMMQSEIDVINTFVNSKING